MQWEYSRGTGNHANSRGTGNHANSRGTRAVLNHMGQVSMHLVGATLNYNDSTTPSCVGRVRGEKNIVEYNNRIPTHYGADERGTQCSPTHKSGELSACNSSARSASLFDVIMQNNLHMGLTVKATSTKRKSSRRILHKFSARSNSSDFSSGYGSVTKQIREVNKESKGDYEFLTKSFLVLRNTALTTIAMMTVLIFPVGMVLLGVKYLHGCPKEPYLPIYLLVGGCFLMLKMFTAIWRQMRERMTPDSIESIEVTVIGENKGHFITNRSRQFTDTILSLFLFLWFGFGNFWTWRIFKPSFSMQLHEPNDWCDETLYMFCVIQIICCYVAFAVFLMAIACLCCARHCCINIQPVSKPIDFDLSEKQLMV